MGGGGKGEHLKITCGYNVKGSIDFDYFSLELIYSPKDGSLCVLSFDIYIYIYIYIKVAYLELHSSSTARVWGSPNI